MSENIKQSVTTLLTEVIDYAGLFPPSRLPMPAAVQNFAAYLRGEYAWMLGRFIVPVSRLNEFTKEAESYFSSEFPWRISALADEELSGTLKEIEQFNKRFNERAVIDTLEIKVNHSTEITLFTKQIPDNLTAYFEIPLARLSEFITPLALTRSRAKIRTGGVTQDAFPPSDEIVKFLRICAAANVPFKATAGLHHPLRCQKPLTYEKNAPSGLMHGFLNVFLTAAFMRQNLNQPFVHELMADGNAENFSFEDSSVSWKKHEIETYGLSLTRKRGAVSFGSCSFLEPIEDLRKIGVL